MFLTDKQKHDLWNQQVYQRTMEALWEYRKEHPFCTYNEYIEVLKRNNANTRINT